MIRWEYNHVAIEGGIPEAIPALDAAGADGWEVIDKQESNYFGTTTFLLKRPLPIEADKDDLVKHNHSIERWCRAGCPWFGTEHQIT